MKQIKLKFVDFWEDFNQNDNFITNILKKHYAIEFSDTPDYVIASCAGKAHLNYEDSVRIFFTGECLTPDFNVFDYALGFEWLKYEDRYLRYPLYFLYEKDYNLMLEKHLNIERSVDNVCNINGGGYHKRNFCSFVVSNGAHCIKERDMIFHKLSEYKKVDSGGRYLNNIGEPNGVADKFEFQRNYKFSIAFENTCHNGYTTEKLVQAFAAKTIPIYYGDKRVSDIFNTKAFVNCHDFNNLDEVVEYVKKIDNDDELYYKMLSEPALKTITTLKEEQMILENFLLNIFNQEKDQAFRRDRFSYSKKYCNHLKEVERIYKNDRASFSGKCKKVLNKLLKRYLCPQTN